MDVNIEEKLEQLAKVPRSARFAAVVGLLVACAAGYYYMFYVDLRAQVDSLRSQSEELQRKLTKVRVVSNNLAEFEQEVADLERELTAALMLYTPDSVIISTSVWVLWEQGEGTVASALGVVLVLVLIVLNWSGRVMLGRLRSFLVGKVFHGRDHQPAQRV